MGTLYANANWNNREGQIDIDATANDTISNAIVNNSIPIKTLIKGYVSPKKNNIDLNINIHFMVFTVLVFWKAILSSPFAR